MSSAVPTPPPTPKTAYSGNSKVAATKAAESEETKTSEGPKVKKIEGVNIVKVKKPITQRIAENFGGDDLKTVGKVLFITVLLPGAKDLMMDFIDVGSRRLIYGDSGRGRSSSGSVLGGGGTRIRTTSYGAASRNISGSPVRESSMGSREKRQFDFSGLIIEDAAKADEIIMEMETAIEEFGVVTVADFFEAIEETGNGYTDRKFGWDAAAFAGAEPKRVRGGWILDIPEPLAIK